MKLREKLALGLISSVLVIGTASASEHNSETSCSKTNMMHDKEKVDPVTLAHKRLSELKDKLEITQNQAPAWQAFSDDVYTQANATSALHDKLLAGMNRASMTTPDRAEMMAEVLKERAQNMALMAVALKKFYNELSPEQKSAFEKMHVSFMKSTHY